MSHLEPAFASRVMFPVTPPISLRCRPLLLQLLQRERVVDPVCRDEARHDPLCATTWRDIAEHARAVEPWLRDIALSRGIDVREEIVVERAPLPLLHAELVVAGALAATADEEGDVGLVAFCFSWLRRRRGLIEGLVLPS